MDKTRSIGRDGRPYLVRVLTADGRQEDFVAAAVIDASPTFLLATGYEQVRSVAAALAGDSAAADRVELELPETGVCCAAPSEYTEVLTLGFRSGTEHGYAGDSSEPLPVAESGCCASAAEVPDAACCAAPADAREAVISSR